MSIVGRDQGASGPPRCATYGAARRQRDMCTCSWSLGLGGGAWECGRRDTSDSFTAWLACRGAIVYRDEVAAIFLCMQLCYLSVSCDRRAVCYQARPLQSGGVGRDRKRRSRCEHARKTIQGVLWKFDIEARECMQGSAVFMILALCNEVAVAGAWVPSKRMKYSL